MGQSRRLSASPRERKRNASSTLLPPDMADMEMESREGRLRGALSDNDDDRVAAMRDRVRVLNTRDPPIDDVS